MNAVKSLRYKSEYFAFLALAAIMRLLPLEFASHWSGRIWRLVAPLFRRHRRALDNLALAFPEKTPAEIDEIARSMWENLGRTFAEFFHIDRIFDSDRIEFESRELVEALRDNGRGVACGLHMGNWEILTQAGMRMGWRPAGVYQRIANPFVDRYVSAVRAPYYPGGLMQKSPRTAVTLLRYAREGGCVALLADQRETRGVASPFFGKPAPSNPFPALVARSVNAPLYVFRAKRLRGVRFSVRIAQVPVPQTDDRDADVAAATRNLQQVLEQMIRDAPTNGCGSIADGVENPPRRSSADLRQVWTPGVVYSIKLVVTSRRRRACRVRMGSPRNALWRQTNPRPKSRRTRRPISAI